MANQMGFHLLVAQARRLIAEGRNAQQVAAQLCAPGRRRAKLLCILLETSAGSDRLIGVPDAFGKLGIGAA